MQPWSLQKVPTVFTGVCTMTDVHQSMTEFIVLGPEGQKSKLQPYVADVGINLWGRDLLSQWGAYVHIPTISEKVEQMFFKMKYPITRQANDRRGLGYPSASSNLS